MKFYISVLLICCGAFFSSLSAQISTVKRTVNGKEYLVHTIEKGQTVYAITKLYGVSDKEIYAANPGAEAGIKAGSELLIPTKGQPVQNNPVKNPQPAEQKYTMHTVLRSETLYGLSKQYGVTVDAILAANPGAAEGLKTGSQLRIPVLSDSSPVTEAEPTKPEIRDEEPEEKPEELPLITNTVPDLVYAYKTQKECLSNPSKKSNYKVALLLPFGTEAKPENKRARVAFHFLAGVESAQKLYKPKGVNIDWEVFNTGSTDDSALVFKLIESGKLAGFDFIVGPLYSSGVFPVAEFAAKNKIPMLAPTVRSSKVIEGNPYVVKATPSPESFNSGLSEYMLANFDHIILVEPASVTDSVNMKLLETELKTLIGKRTDKTVSYTEAGKTSAMDMVKPNVRNLIYYPTKRELTVSGFLTGMRKVKKSDKITVMGDESWLRFKNFDPDYYNNVSLQVPVTSFVSTEIEEYKDFVKAFREAYKTDPEVYAFRGFDAACFVTDMLESYGNALPECLRFDTNRYLMAPFKLVKIPGGGFDNKGVLIIKVNEFALELGAN